MNRPPASGSVASDLKLRPIRVVQDGLGILMREPFLLFGLAIVATFAATAMDLVVHGLVADDDLAHILGMIVQAGGSAAASVAVTRAVLACADGREIGFGEAYHALSASAFRVLGTSFVLTIGILLGMVMFVIPGLWLATIWIVAVPAAIVEDLPPAAAAKRSADLSRGNRWPAFALILLSLLVGVGFALLIGVLIGLPVSLSSGPDLVRTQEGFTRFGQILQSTGAAIQVVITATFAALAWRRLCWIQERRGAQAATSP